MAHLHLFAKAEVRRPLVTQEAARRFLARAIRLAGMRVIGGPWAVMGVVPGNEGVSATAILDYSSANLHEWPDAKPYPLIHFDLYTCGKSPDPDAFRALFVELLDPVSVSIAVKDRDELLVDSTTIITAAR